MVAVMEPPGRWQILPLYLDSVVYPEGHPRSGETGPVYAFVLESDEYLVLVDTGLGPPHSVIDRYYQPRRRGLEIALAQNNGIEPADVTAVVLTHLHFDHVGWAQLFPGKPLYAQRAEIEAARASDYTIREWVEFDGARYVPVDGPAELAPGLRLIPTPGHTPGHQSIAVDTFGGLMVIAGQAVETAAELEGMVASGELSEAGRTILELEPVRVLFSHDHREWTPGA